VLDLRIAHERWESSSDPSLNGHLHYPHDVDRTPNEAAADKIRQYRADYNNRPSNAISFIPAIASDRFFAASGVQLAQSTSGQFHYRRAAFSSQLRSKVGNILAKAAALRITLNIDGAPIPSKSQSPITLANLSFINLVSIFRCSSHPRNPVYASRVDPSALAFSLSSHRHSYRSPI
jgi:hypothetical protein